MAKSELLRRASLTLGIPVLRSHLEHAIEKGFVTRTVREENGWCRYGDQQLRELVEYMRTRSRTYQMREVAEAV